MKKQRYDRAVSFRVDGERLDEARKHYNVSEYVRWLIDALANQQLELEASKTKMRFKK